MTKSNQEQDINIHVAYYSATSHMLNLEENMMNLKDFKTQVTIGDSRTLTGTTFGNWHGWQRRDRKIHRVTITNTYVIPCMHENIFSVTQALQK